MILGVVFALSAATPAFAIGQCQKPVEVDIPADASHLPLSGFSKVREQGEAYLQNAHDYLACLNAIIYNYAPEDPIVSKAGKAHQEYAQEWVPVWGDLNLACVNWEAEHGVQFPGGCQPLNPAEG